MYKDSAEEGKMSRRKQSRPNRVQDEDVKNNSKEISNTTRKTQQDEDEIENSFGIGIMVDENSKCNEDEGFNAIEETGLEIFTRDQIKENGQISINTLICKSFQNKKSSNNKIKSHVLMSSSFNKKMCSEMQIKSEKDDNLRDEKTDIKHVFSSTTTTTTSITATTANTISPITTKNNNIHIQEMSAAAASDKNNNAGDDGDENDENVDEDVNEGNCELDDDESQISLDSSCALDLSIVSSSSSILPRTIPPPGHVTFEALQNTKVAVAQFAATAMASSKNYDETIKDLAVVQSTFFNLHRQQMLQMQLIQELQSRLLVNQKDMLRSKEDILKNPEDKDLTKVVVNKENSKQSDQISPAYDLTKSEKFEEKPKEEIVVKKDTKVECVTTKNRNENQTTLPKSNDTSKLKSNEYPTQSPQLCHISSSLASSIITNHDPLPPPDEPNSLEMLQRRTQEVLDSASQGILATNLADEIALRKDNMSQDGKGKNEPFFKHRCKYCGKIFGSDSALQIHIRSHTGERPFHCDVCGSKFTTKGNLKVHYQRHTQRYPCGPLMGPGPEYLDNYAFTPPQIPIDQIPPGITAPISERLVEFHPPFYNAFGNFPQIRSEMELPQNSDRNFENKKGPEVIEQVEQVEPTDLSKSSKNTESFLDCNKNSDEKKFSEELKQNSEVPKSPVIPISQNITVPQKYIQNPVKDFVKESQISPVNLSKDQPSPSPSTPSEVSFVSDTNSDLPSISNMITNATQSNDHSWENLIEIAKPSETSKLQQLVDNIENKLADPNQCVFCQKILSCRSALQMHYRTHTGERPFRCRICGRAFATKGNLKAHMIIHKIKPPIRSQFKCPVCHNKFSNALALQEHIRTHTKESFDNFQNKDQMMMNNSSGDERNFEHMNFELTFSENSEQKSEISQDDCDDDDIMEIDDDDDDEEDDEKNFLNVASEMNNLRNEMKTLNERLHENKSNPTSLSSGDTVDGALDLTPKAKSISSVGNNNNAENAITQNQNMNKFPPFLSFPYGGLRSSPVQVLPHTLTPLAQNILPVLPFHPFGITGIRGSTTCNICYKTFACTSALEIHFRSHTKERPFKCGVCDRAFSTKKEECLHTTFNCANKNGNLKQHFLTHKHCEASAQSSSASEDESSSYSFPKKFHSPVDHHSSSTIGKHFPNDHVSIPTLPLSPIDLVRDEDSIKKQEEEDQHKLNVKRNLSSTATVTTTYVEQSFPKHHLETSTYDSSIIDSSSTSPSPMMSLSEIENSTSFQNYFKENSECRNYSPTNSDLDQSSNTKHFCTICRKNFSSTSALQIHMRTHTGDKPFRCTICQKAFTTKGNLKVHMSTHMWTNGASRRGRRMSLEFPLGRSPIGNHLGDSDYLPRRSDMFYPYIPPTLNGMQHKVSTDLKSMQPTGYSGYAPISPNHMPGKYSGLFGFGPFMPSSPPTGIHQFPIPSMKDTRTQDSLVNTTKTTTTSSKEDSRLVEMKSPFWKMNLMTESKGFQDKEIPFNQNSSSINSIHNDSRTENAVKV